MSEITIAARIKMARKMAELSTQAALLEKISEWRPSRLGNYEAGISMPGPEDILKIARATSSSPCWLMFGIGPIRSNHRDLQAIRHQNLYNRYAETSDDKEQLARFCRALKITKSKLLQHIDNPFEPIDDEFARRFEKNQKLSQGWMDEQHVEHDPLCLSFPEDIRELMSLYSTADKNRRSLMLAILRTLANHPQDL